MVGPGPNTLPPGGAPLVVVPPNVGAAVVLACEVCPKPPKGLEVFVVVGFEDPPNPNPLNIPGAFAGCDVDALEFRPPNNPPPAVVVAGFEVELKRPP